MRLRRHRHREQRAAVEGALEGDHGRPLRVRAGELDRVLDRLGAGVEERRLGGAGDRRDRDQPLGELDVDLVRDDREVGVREARELLLRRLDDARVRVADVQAADAAGEVDERVAVDVGERRAAGPRPSTIGWTSESGAAITRSLRSMISFERGPGSSVRISIDLVTAMRVKIAQSTGLLHR